MTLRELFEIIEDLCKVYGVKKVKTTVLSFFEILENKNNGEVETSQVTDDAFGVNQVSQFRSDN